MRLGLISDAHGNSLGLAAVAKEFRRQGVERVLMAGDLVGYYPYVNEVFDTLLRLEPVSVLGNHDMMLLRGAGASDERWNAYNLEYVDQVLLPEHRAFLAQLPTEARFEIDGRVWLLCHGSPWRVDEYVYADHEDVGRFLRLAEDVVVMGHTHIPYVRSVGEKVLINPGSCGQPRDVGWMASGAIVDSHSLETRVVRVPFDAEAVRARIRDLRFDPSLADILIRDRRSVSDA